MKKLSTLTALSVIFVVGFGLRPYTAHSRVVMADLGIDALACPFCAIGLERNLKQLKGQVAWDIVMDPGLAPVSFSDDTSASVEELTAASEDAGMAIRHVRAAVRGAVRYEDEIGWVFETLQHGEIFLLEENEMLSQFLKTTAAEEASDAEIPALLRGKIDLKTETGFFVGLRRLWRRDEPDKEIPAFEMEHYCVGHTRRLVVEDPCEHCPERVESLLAELEGVRSVWALVIKDSVHVLACTADKSDEVTEDIAGTLEDAGFTVTGEAWITHK